MSSLRNSLHRRNHKERSQLAHRSRLGILEKHKDYVIRARDYHSKQDRITRLKQKASQRNKDEFYFAMNRQRTEGGVHVQERGNEALPIDMVKVLKSQDENYIRTTRLAGLKKIDRIKAQLSTIADLLGSRTLDGNDYGEHNDLDEEELEILHDAGIIARPSTTSRRSKSKRPAPKHIVFAESEEQARTLANMPRAAQSHDVPSPSVRGPSDLGWKVAGDSTKGKKGRTQSSLLDEAGQDVAERQQEAREHRSQLLKELSARLHRDQQLRYAERELEMQKLLMGKGGSRKLAGVEKVDGEDGDSEDEGRGRREKVDEKTWKPRVYKWRVERKR
ncbi:u3 small nucleolar RNA-associated protein 11 [Cristinia sonorae]|uniref:U3 small nucleolar RNA-associated protein 11 n=1 Tax=Cristinia sonorae TaxID=1940300 RepID=A0A8K0UMC4_9AGAR|nr:u3 small nucleolar RNA-associated protein 11 [Cristinia sonorae]